MQIFRAIQICAFTIAPSHFAFANINLMTKGIGRKLFLSHTQDGFINSST
jgi:hypothetical protein